MNYQCVTCEKVGECRRFKQIHTQGSCRNYEEAEWLRKGRETGEIKRVKDE